MQHWRSRRGTVKLPCRKTASTIAAWLGDRADLVAATAARDHLEAIGRSSPKPAAEAQ
jgi:hypothetical protein